MGDGWSNRLFNKLVGLFCTAKIPAQFINLGLHPGVGQCNLLKSLFYYYLVLFLLSLNRSLKFLLES